MTKNNCLVFTPSLNDHCLVDRTALNRTLVPTDGPLINSDGSFTLNQIDAWGREFIETYAQEAENNPIAIAEDRYGDELYTTLNDLNIFLKATQLTSFPDLSARVQRGQISVLEYSDFLDEFNYQPQAVISKSIYDPSSLLFEMDSYYKNSFSNSILGGFCKTIEQVFGAIDAFFDIIDQVQGFIADAVSFIRKLKSGKFFFEAAAKAAALALIKAIKDKIEEIICAAWERIKKSLFNFNILNFINTVENFVDITVIKNAKRLRDETISILTEENCFLLVERIKKLFDYAVGILETPTLAEIQFLILRFCSFISNVEALLYDLKNPSQNFAIKYQTIVNRLERASFAASAVAVSAGATRFSKEKRKEKADQLAIKWSQGIDSTGLNIPTPTGQPPRNPPPPTAQEIKDIPDYDTIKNGGSSVFSFVNNGKSFPDKEATWYMMDYTFLTAIMRIQAKIGKKFEVLDGWRSQQVHNKIGSTQSSYHMQGLALNISSSNLTDDDISEIRKLAEPYHFSITSYGSYIHIEPSPIAWT